MVADLLGNGEQYIISLTRNYNKCDDYVTCYSSLDKDGDKLPDMLWRTNIGMMSCYRPPVVTDVDAPDGKGEKEIVFRSEFEKKPIVIMDAHGNIKASFGNLSGDFFGEPAVATSTVTATRKSFAALATDMYTYGSMTVSLISVPRSSPVRDRC